MSQIQEIIAKDFADEVAAGEQENQKVHRCNSRNPGLNRKRLARPYRRQWKMYELKDPQKM